MLKVPQLDNLSFDKLFERARSRIPSYTGEWTDFNHHDPGITTLQVYAWLADTLNFYINATGEEHRLKYLKLLGLQPERAAARCNIALFAPDAEEILIPAGTRIAAGDVVFEFEETYRSSANRLLGLFNEVDGAFHDLTPFAGVDDGFARIFSRDREQESSLYFCFVAPVGGEFRFWVEVGENLPRNPFGDDFSLSELAWEYFDGSRWRAATLIKDQTCGFLRSGFLTLSLGAGTARMENPILPPGHYLRCRMVKNEYDVLPLIGRVVLNCAEVVQTNTYVRALSCIFEGATQIPIDYRFRENDRMIVAVEESDGRLRLWHENSPDSESYCEFLPGESEWQKILCFDREKFGRVPETGKKILIIICAEAAWDMVFPGRTSGCAEERLEFDAENLCDLQLALIDPKDGGMQIWSLCDDIRQASCDDAVFSCDAENREIVFGNAINGMQPDAGQIVMAISVRTSRLENGHVRKGQVNRFLDPVQPGLTAFNLADAAGGKTPGTSQELQGKIEQKLNRVTRAVNIEDYRTLVMETPGLIVDLVSVISMKEYADAYNIPRKPNTVLVAVKPYSAGDARATLTDKYRAIIRENLERYRLLTTNIEVIPPRYAGIVVHGRILLTENTPQNRQALAEQLHQMIDFSVTRRFGGKINYGNVFSRLEMMECVRRVEQLSFEYLGDGARGDEQGDVIICPDTLAYLKNIDIEYN